MKVLFIRNKTDYEGISQPIQWTEPNKTQSFTVNLLGGNVWLAELLSLIGYQLTASEVLLLDGIFPPIVTSSWVYRI